MRTIVWFRGKDLRLADHAPLRDAIAGGEVIPLFVLDPYFFAPARAQELPHRIQFLLESLQELADAIRERGSTLVVVRGKSTEVVPELAAKWRADRVVAHRWVEPVGRERDRRIDVELYEGETLVAPGTLRTKAGTPFKVFSQFAHAHAKADPGGPPLPAPRAIPPLPVRAASVAIPRVEELGIARNPQVIEAGERAALRRLAHFKKLAAQYATGRDRMDLPLTSRLSQDLKFGTLSVRQVWHALGDAVFRNELVWREFSHSTLWDFPALLDEPFQARWAKFPWRTGRAADADWRTWAEGRTGYPVVDAAARQLLAEGFVHNRARMIAASFLAKHLLVDFRRGEAHYLKYLTDGDWAQNDLNWQWSAGCGCDAQPYFRVFNPMLQGAKFDPDGDYVRRWVPELAGVPAKYVHAPWTAPSPPRGYPEPIVEHAMARERFLAIAKAHLRR